MAKTPKAPPAPKHVPTEQTRQQVTAMAGFGIERKDIATCMGLEADELGRHYRRELRVGDAQAKVQLGKSVYDFAVGRGAIYDEAGRQVREELKPDKNVAVFMAKARLGFRDSEIVYVERQLSNLKALSQDERKQLAALLEKADPPAGGQPPAANDEATPGPGPRVRRATGDGD